MEEFHGYLKSDVIKRNVMKCSYCGGTVNRYEHMFQCENCGAIGDLVTGIMVDTRIKITPGDIPRCKACSDCPMGVTGCEWDDKPHGHGCAQRCDECGVAYYHVHPHSNVCPRATPVKNDVVHDITHMKHQLRWKKIEWTKILYCDTCGEETEHKLDKGMSWYICQKCKIPPGNE